MPDTNYDTELVDMENTDKPRSRWSTVWQYCTDLKNGKAICNLCGTELAYHSHISKSTYNLKRHLRLKHATVGMTRRNKSSTMMWKFRREEDPKRSSVWAHCTIVGDRKVRCDLCKAELVYLNGSTHNLKRHLEAKHTREEMQSYTKSTKAEQNLQDLINLNYKRMTSGKKSVVLSSAVAEAMNEYIHPAAAAELSSSKFVDDDSDCEFVAHKPILSLTKQRFFDDALIDTLSLDFLPSAIVDDLGFREFVAQLQPMYVLPRRRTVCKTLLPQRFERLGHRRRVEMQSVQSVCLTIESWNLANSDERCFSVTAHFIGVQFEMKSYALDCFLYTCHHTITYMKDELMRIADEWHIQEKIVAVVTNNAIEILTAIDLIGWPRLPCFIDTLNSIASEAMLEIDEILMKIRSTVDYFRFNTVATEMLHSLLLQMDMAPMDLVPDFGSNWTTAFKMMRRFFELREPVVNITALIADPLLHVLSWSDWDVVARACELLMPLFETTDEVCLDSFMSASKAVVMVRGLLRLCHDQLAVTGHPPTIEKMLSILTTSLTNWFSTMELNPLLAESTLLDPRFKTTGFSDSTASDMAKRNIIESAGRTMLKSDMNNANVPDMPRTSSLTEDKKKQKVISASVWAEYDDQVSSNTAQAGHQYKTACTSITSNSCKKLSEAACPSSSVWTDYDLKVLNIAVADNPEVEATKQIQRFLDEPLLGRQSSCLEWWKGRETLYPRLMPVVKERLCIVANAVASELVFSPTALITNIRRRSLSPNEMRCEFFLNSNVCV